MTEKALSKLPSFRDALVLSAGYSNAPGVSGFCELGIRWRKTQIEVWNWCDDIGSECVVKLPPNLGHQELVKALAGNDVVASAVNPFSVTIHGDKPPLGALLALLWGEGFDTQDDAVLLAALPWDYLQSVHSSGVDLCSRETHAMLDELKEEMADSYLYIEDVLPIPTPSGTSLADIRAAIRLAIATAIKVHHEVVQKAQAQKEVLDAKLAPFRDKIEKVYENYRKIEHPRRYPGGGSLPPKGFNQLKRYVESFVSQHGDMPSGVHEIPEGSDIFGSQGDAFELDFDAMQRELPFRLVSRWEPGRYVWFWHDPSTNWTSGDFDSKKEAITAWASGRVRIG